MRLEIESLRICAGLVERLVSRELDWRVEYVLARMVHSAGDPMILKLIKHSDNLPNVLEGLSKSLGRVIVDVEMVAAGVRGRCEGLGLDLRVAVRHGIRGGEGVVASGAKELIRLGLIDGRSLIVNGSSPSFLEVILDSVESEVIKPLMIIATPPGFIKAPEVKERLLRVAKGTPYIALMGSRGGSPIAAAAANAVLDIASGRALRVWREVKGCHS